MKQLRKAWIAAAAITAVLCTGIAMGTSTVHAQEVPAMVVQEEESAVVSAANGWYTSPAGNKFYFDENGNKVTGWQTIDGNKYYFRESGVMQTMWARIDGDKYYFGKTGVMRTMWQTIGGEKYYFGGTGVMRTMWETIGGNKYYFGKTGVMRTMWQTIGGNKYYFGKTGVMRTMWETIGGNKYYFGKTGVMRTMWETIGGDKYYFGKTGVMRQGWETIGGNKYYFGKSGVMRTMFQTINDKPYYFGLSGIMRQGWERVDGYLYYFGKSGVMRTGNVTVDGVNCYFGSTGRLQDRNGKYMLTSKQKFSYEMNDGKTWTVSGAKLVKVYSYTVNGAPAKIGEYQITHEGEVYYIYQVYRNGYYTNYTPWALGYNDTFSVPLLARVNGSVEVIDFWVSGTALGFSAYDASFLRYNASDDTWWIGERQISEAEAKSIANGITFLGKSKELFEYLLS